MGDNDANDSVPGESGNIWWAPVGVWGASSSGVLAVPGGEMRKIRGVHNIPKYNTP